MLPPARFTTSVLGSTIKEAPKELADPSSTKTPVMSPALMTLVLPEPLYLTALPPDPLALVIFPLLRTMLSEAPSRIQIAVFVPPVSASPPSPPNTDAPLSTRTKTFDKSLRLPDACAMIAAAPKPVAVTEEVDVHPGWASQPTITLMPVDVSPPSDPLALCAKTPCAKFPLVPTTVS